MTREYTAAIAAWEKANGKTVNVGYIDGLKKVIGFDPLRAIEAGNYDNATRDKQRLLDSGEGLEGLRKTVAYVNCIATDLFLREMVQPEHCSVKWQRVVAYERQLLDVRGFDVANMNSEEMRERLIR